MKRSVSKFSSKTVSAIDWIFYSTLGRMNYFKEFSPDIQILGNTQALIVDVLKKERLTRNEKLKFLDIGARDAVRSSIAEGYEYYGMDIQPGSKDVMVGDICACPEIEDNTFDVIFSMDVLEHVSKPWDAAKESIRIVKPGGLIIHRTLFSYRYHPSPVDYWRFTSQGLEYLFTESGETETLIKGYETRRRRRNYTGSSISSKPPIDWLGGFRENWQVLWIGRKN